MEFWERERWREVSWERGGRGRGGRRGRRREGVCGGRRVRWRESVRHSSPLLFIIICRARMERLVQEEEDDEGMRMCTKGMFGRKVNNGNGNGNECKG